jgi:hypothetical protein
MEALSVKGRKLLSIGLAVISLKNFINPSDPLPASVHVGLFFASVAFFYFSK